MSALPRTERGGRTRAKILEVATAVFAERGYHDASIVKITEAAGVGQGTFYLYFASKQEVFEEVVRDLNSRVRRAMVVASNGQTGRLAAEREGFRAYFRFTADNPALYRIMRQAEFVAPHVLREHYERIAAGYVAGLQDAQQHGELAESIDPEVAAWALMGIGELVGLRWVLWEHENGNGHATMPPHVFESTMRLIERALTPLPGEGSTTEGRSS
ncbi:TetR/AcrR family transcriptional regulator [Georgenia yuyongxinii]|uniref:TetR/AcrR family transcriptional regulator n=1 Tax=Georgenia yuyongxinii TaxID=2589797 RepID=A0A552WJB1_9MICO|nr:TetR/AcrR family transcriptional regulator [Georgenia yuyongxinii]TRW42827.1 TetR/AcrR family transcriptional regulator [Georgenia yuyongxinii]